MEDNVKYNDKSVVVALYVSEGFSNEGHWRLGKGLNITFSPKFIFLFSAECIDIKYSMPVSDKDYSPLEVAAATKIQALWRGSYVRLLMRARTPGIICQCL